MEPHTPPNKKAIAIGLGVIILCGVIFIAVASGKKTAAPVTGTSSDDAPTAPAADSTVTTTTTTTASSGTQLYKDGTYSATGSYISPGGPDQVGVSLTLANDIVTSLTVTPEPGDHTSARYQAMFASGINQYVVGKDITTLKISKVSGSSLTSEGFNDALRQIETQAKA